MKNDFHALLPTVMEFMLDAIFLVDRDGVILQVSNACEAILGYSPKEMTGRPLVDFQAPEDRVRTAEEASRVIAGHPRVGFENRYVHKDGHYVYLMWSARWLDEASLRIGVARDVSARKEAELRQAASHAILAATQDAIDLPDLCHRLHRILEDLLPIALFAVVAESEQGDVNTLYAAGNLLQGDCPLEWYRQFDREDTIVPAIALRFPQQNGMKGAIFVRPARVGGCTRGDHELLRFVTGHIAIALERKRLYADLLQAARYDDLTGLPNRRLFHDRLATALARSSRCNKPIGVIFGDVDGFKQVNDTLGHSVGDGVLKEVARRLVGCARASDTVARLSGDEFVILVENLAARDDANHIAEKIADAMSVPIDTPEGKVDIGLSLGIAIFPDDTASGERLLTIADCAMYEAKQRKGSDR